MKLTGVKQVLKSLATTKTNITPMLWGQHGIGKSSIVYQLAQELGYSVYSIILSQKEAVDVAGVLYTFENKELGMSVTSAHPPDWFASALLKGRVILFLDELNMARREVMNAAFELILDRRLNNRKLPDDVLVVAAGNPDDERYDVTPMSQSLRDRLMHIKVEPDVNTWLAWAKTSGNIHPDVVCFIETNPDAAYAVDSRDAQFPVELKHSLRSWERISNVHKIAVLDLPQELKFECVRGIVGPELAQAFMQSFGNIDLPLLASEILQLKPTTVKRIKEYANPSGTMRIDLLSRSIENLVAHTKANAGKDLDDNKRNNVIAFIKLLPNDCANYAILGLMDHPCNTNGQMWAALFVNDKDIEQQMNLMAEAKAI